ncbi:MAG TPA: CotH kinase family protein, partial [Polyangiales bacterium]|nr:CotH kinase family protein [Polyangiales bacterium]
MATCVVLASGACSSHGGGSAKQTTASPNNGGGSSFAGNGAGGAFGTSGNGGAQAGGGSGGTGTLGDAGASSADAAMMVATGPGSVVAAPQDDAQFLWDDTQLRTFELTIAQSDLDAINAAPADEQFVPAAFKVGNETVQNAAVRYKGSIGAFYGCVSGGTFWQPSGMKTCKKLSMKVSFDEYDAKQRFHGLKKLNFHSMNDDDSLLRDRLGYAMFREAGIAAPRCVHARLMINGTFAGLFALVEEIDGRFTDTHFTAVGDGNLYKEIWPSTTDVSAYRVALRTHQSDPNAPIDRIVRFASAIGAASDD